MNSLDGPPRALAARKIEDAVAAADRKILQPAIEATYDPDILSKCDAATITNNSMCHE